MPLRRVLDWQGRTVWVFVPRERPQVVAFSETFERSWVLYADDTAEPTYWVVGSPGFYMVPAAKHEFIARRST